MYKSLYSCIEDLKKTNQIIVIEEEIDPYLLASEIHRQIYKKNGPAIFFKKIKGSKYPAVCNLFGTFDRCAYLFRKDFHTTKELIRLVAEKKPHLKTLKVLPKIKNSFIKNKKFDIHQWQKISISDLPLIQSYPMDGGAFITLPMVLSMGIDKNIKMANLGMYRIQLTGNKYQKNKEIGLHYQIHRGIAVHHKEHLIAKKDFYVSIFVGGTPAHAFSAVMPLPENISELSFAGVLGGRRFRYSQYKHYIVSEDSDFCILGKIKKENMPEGPFGDHLGYYSLEHPFPAMEVECVLAKPNAIWSFTTVGRPPQEDTSFGHFIHALTSDIIKKEIAGIKEINAVDEAGVHPLLLAIGSERYAPFYELKYPQELLTQAYALLGKGQLSLTKYLFIANIFDNEKLSCQNMPNFFSHILKRINWKNDVHIQTKTPIDTLDYSSKEINFGSKVIFAAIGKEKRVLATKIAKKYLIFKEKYPLQVINQGILAIQLEAYTNKQDEQIKIQNLCAELTNIPDCENDFPLIILVDDASYISQNFANFLWITFTRSNPSEDIHGVEEFCQDKHWGCKKSLLIDARIKAHHAPELEIPEEIQKKAGGIIMNYEL